MYDTVFFKIDQREAGGVDFLSETPCFLDGVSEHYYDGVPVISGMVDNLRVAVSQHKIKVKDGSLCKFLFGNNYNTMTRHDVQQAIEKLSDRLHIQMNDATVTRLDIAQNFIMQYPLDVYYNHLGMLNQAKRLVEPSGLYYVQGCGRLCIYDKNQEQREHKEPIPPLYQDKNVLRVEQRYLRRLPQKLHRPEVKGATLHEADFFNEVIDLWRGGYMAIQKINEVTFNFEAMKTVKNTLLMAFATVIQQGGGEVAFIDGINESYKMGKLTKKQAHDLRETVKRANALNTDMTTRSEVIQELDTKVNQAARMYK